MTYTVEILKRAEKFLRSISDAKLYRKIREAIDSFEMDPFPPGSKKLVGTPNLHRLRVGDYRIIYKVDGGNLIILVVTIGHRRDIYH